MMVIIKMLSFENAMGALKKRINCVFVYLLFGAMIICAFEHPYDIQQYVGVANLPLETPLESSEQLTQLVSPVNGDMHLGIPLAELDVGNNTTYTIVLGYNAGIKQNQQASSVGLGWTINPGAILRSTKGYPDDRKGQGIVVENWGGSASNTGANYRSISKSDASYIIRDEKGRPLSVDWSSINSLRPISVNMMAFSGSYGVAFNGSSFSMLHASKPLPPSYSVSVQILDNWTYNLNMVPNSLYGIMYRGLEPGNRASEQEADFRFVITTNNNLDGSINALFRRYRKINANGQEYRVSAWGTYHDNYIVQGPAPSGIMFWDDTEQIDGYGNPSNTPSESGFYYVNRKSQNSAYAPSRESEMQGVKVIHSFDNDGAINGFTIVDVTGIKYYYYKPVRLRNLIDEGNILASWSLATYGKTHDEYGRNSAWMLTAIVYPDFDDGGNIFDGSNNNHLMDPQDKGSYIAFTYEDPYSNFRFRDPEYDEDTDIHYRATPPAIQGYGFHNNFKYSKSRGETNYPILKKIETPVAKALFTLSDRLDAIESPALGETRRKLQKIDKVEVYSKFGDKLQKTINFKYNYELAPNSYQAATGNATKGRLTLKELQVCKGGVCLPPMSASYVFNPPADMGAEGEQNVQVDRWGNYCSECDFEDHTVKNPHDATAWSLTSLDMPLGYRIQFSYLSDHYNFVGNLRPLDKVGDAATVNEWATNTVNAKYGPDICVTNISMKNTVDGTKLDGYSFSYGTGVVTEEAPSMSTKENNDTPIWPYPIGDPNLTAPIDILLTERVLSFHKDPRIDNTPFTHVYEDVTISKSENPEYGKQMEFSSPRDQEPRMFISENPDFRLSGNVVMDYRAAFHYGRLEKLKEYATSDGQKVTLRETDYGDFRISNGTPHNNNSNYDGFGYYLYATNYRSFLNVRNCFLKKPVPGGEYNWEFDDPNYRKLVHRVFYSKHIARSTDVIESGVRRTESYKYDKLSDLPLRIATTDENYMSKIQEFELERNESKNVLNLITSEKVSGGIDDNDVCEWIKRTYSTAPSGTGTNSLKLIEEKALDKKVGSDGVVLPIEESDFKLQFKVDRFDEFGKIEQKTNARDIPETIVYNHHHKGHADKKIAFSKNTIATIKNATFKECGVYTCDYDANPDESYFDYHNGWQKGGKGDDLSRQIPSGPAIVEVTSDAAHFGTAGLKVTNSFGPTRNFKLENRSDYILSAWIKSASGNVPIEKHVVIGGDYRKRENAEGEWPIDVYSCNTQGACKGSDGDFRAVNHGEWTYIEMEMPASEEISYDEWSEGFQYARVWVGAPYGDNQGGDGAVYIDDIRFYPKDALVTTTYYDERWEKPMLTVDANNNPSRLVEHDDFGRPAKWYKIDITKPQGETGYKLLLEEKVYQFGNSGS